MSLNKIAIYVVVTLALMAGGFYWHDKKMDAFELRVQKELNAQYNSRLVSLQKKADELGIELEDKIKRTTDEKNAQIASLNSRVGVLTASMSNRPSNRQSSSGNSTNPTGPTESKTGATGLQLSRPDSEFLSWFGGRTQELQIELKKCYVDYDTAKQILDKYRRDNAIRN